MSDAHALAELGIVTVASPCEADWSAMRGDDRVRHCALCNLNVYNAEGLNAFEVRDLFKRSEGRVCMRLYQREDGTLITKDCPVGWAAVQHAWRAQAARAKLLSPRFLVWASIAIIGTSQMVFAQWGDDISPWFKRSECAAPSLTAAARALGRARRQEPQHTMGLVIMPKHK